MIRLPEFSYVAARTVTEAVRALADAGADGMPVAGGTDLYPNMKRRQFEPKTLIGLRTIKELRGVGAVTKAGVSVGACTTLTAVATHPALARDYPALAIAAGLVSSPQLRNMGTLGGNVCVDTRCNYYNQSFEWRQAIGFCMKKDGDICLVAPGSPRCWAVSSSDTAPALWSLGARVRLAGPAGERTIPIAELYHDDGIRYLAKRADEIVTELVLPPADGWRSTYLKLRRRGSFDFPILGVAAAVRLDGEVVREARIVLGAVASLPREAPKAAALLVGRRLTRETIEAAADAAAGPARPLDNTDLTHPYRKKVARVFVARALARLAGLDHGPEMALRAEAFDGEASP
ncbi:MAG TPA: FAD binding domain-containing protein [Methylomirabilota bacterium]|nr:FAD binding domain-containing protein [Methylomirabilota bacterium]